MSYQYGLAAGATGGVVLNLATGVVTGGSGRDRLERVENATGSSLGDTLVGSAGANVLRGGAGNDRLSGGDGNDRLVGGTGRDTLLGGNGRDVFDFDATDETGLDSGTWDVIRGFVRGQDRIDLSTIDANTATAANEAFTTLTVGGAWTGAMSGGAGRLYFDRVNGVLYGNTDGDAEAEFAIQLTGLTALSVGDLIL